MNEEFILNLLALKHGLGFAFFPKFRPMTGYAAVLNEIIGYWGKLLMTGGIWKQDVSAEFNELLSLIKRSSGFSNIKRNLRPIRDSINKLLEEE